MFGVGVASVGVTCVGVACVVVVVVVAVVVVVVVVAVVVAAVIVDVNASLMSPYPPPLLPSLPPSYPSGFVFARPPNATSPILYKSHTPFFPSYNKPSLMPEQTCMLLLLVRNPIDNQDAWTR